MKPDEYGGEGGGGGERRGGLLMSIPSRVREIYTPGRWASRLCVHFSHEFFTHIQIKR